MYTGIGLIEPRRYRVALRRLSWLNRRMELATVLSGNTLASTSVTWESILEDDGELVSLLPATDKERFVHLWIALSRCSRPDSGSQAPSFLRSPMWHCIANKSMRKLMSKSTSTNIYEYSHSLERGIGVGQTERYSEYCLQTYIWT